MIMSEQYPKFVESVATIRSSVREMMELCAKIGVYEVFGPWKQYDLFGHGEKLTADMLWYDRLIKEIIKEQEQRTRSRVGRRVKSRSDGVAPIGFKGCRRQYHSDDDTSRISFWRCCSLSTATLQWAMAVLINNLAILEKLREKIRSVVPKGMIKESDIPNLPCLQSVAKETLRLHTPTTPLLFRECSRDCQVGEYRVKAGIRVFINMYVIMRNPGMWTDQEEFVPERFLIKDAAIMDFQYFPSGGGRRACIGTAFANTVMTLTIGTLAQCFDWQIENGAKVNVNVRVGILWHHGSASTMQSDQAIRSF